MNLDRFSQKTARYVGAESRNNKDADRERARACGKGQLAELYYPDSSPSWALRLLNKDIHRMPGLTERLRQRGWRPTDRLLRRDWVQLIFDAIGPP